MGVGDGAREIGCELALDSDDELVRRRRLRSGENWLTGTTEPGFCRIDAASAEEGLVGGVDLVSLDAAVAVRISPPVLEIR